MTGDEKLLLKGLIIALILKIVLSFLLIPVIGLAGAALTRIAISIGTNLLFWVVVKRRLGFFVYPFSNWKHILRVPVDVT